MIVLKHIFYRILVLVGLIVVAIRISFAFINPHSFCGTGDAITIFFFTLIASAIWIVYLIIEAILLHRIIEAILLHRQKAYGKRNANLLLSLLVPLIVILIIKILYI